MVESRVDATVERGRVIVTYDGDVIKKLDPDEAIDCGGDIAAAGRQARRYQYEPEDVRRKQDSTDGEASYPDNRSSSHSSANLSGDSGSDDEQEEDWRGENKNSLLNGKL